MPGGGNGNQRVGHDLVTEQEACQLYTICLRPKTTQHKLKGKMLVAHRGDAIC